MMPRSQEGFWVDSKEKLVSVMVQEYPGPTVGATFLPLVHQALVR